MSTRHIPSLAAALSGQQFASSTMRPGIARRISPLGPMVTPDEERKGRARRNFTAATPGSGGEGKPVPAPVTAKAGEEPAAPRVATETAPQKTAHTKEEAMPKGIYKRSKKTDAGAPPTADHKPVRRKAKTPARRPQPTDRKPGDARFLRDDLGGLLIRDGQQEIKLEPRDVDRLRVFLVDAKAAKR